MRYGTVAIVGRTNVGKSTFLNAALGTPLAIVSHQPQTTRDLLLGVVHGPDLQIAFVDTPGLHRPRNELGRRTNAEAVDSLRSADAALFVTDVFQRQRTREGEEGAEGEVKETRPRSRHAPEPRSDRDLISLLPEGLPTVLVVNKVDRLRDKTKLLPFLQELNEVRSFAATVPISALRNEGVDRVLAELARLLPERAAGHDEDALTDRPLSFFAREYIREQILGGFGQEVPHAVAVTIDAFDERATGFHVSATIHVEKPGQRAILVGRGGEKIRDIGTAARHRLEQLAEQPVHLRLFVRVTDAWRSAPRRLSEFGYGR
jgi:GTPase